MAGRMTGRLTHDIEQATPRGRNRYVDALRVAALTAVVLGHWMVPVFATEDGGLTVRLVMTEHPWTRWVTWVFQVMPVFFIVGGFANAAAWSRASANGETAVAWASRRARRLLRPLLPLVAVWVVVVVAGELAGFEDRWLAQASQSALVPAWFLAVYVVVTVAVPVTARIDARIGLWPALGLLVIVSALSDAVSAAGWNAAQWTNFVWVWFAIHQLGIAWHRRGLLGPAGGTALLAGGLAVLYGLVTLAGYPADMVAEANGQTNATPPSVAMLALATAQLGVIALGRGVGERVLTRPRVWAPVAIAGRRIMSIFLWHMTAMIAVAAALGAIGWLPLSDALGWGWWASRPVWLLTCAAALAVIVVVVAWAERIRDGASGPASGQAPDPASGPASDQPSGLASGASEPSTPSAPGPVAVTAGAGVAALAVGVLAAGGVHDPEGPLGLALWPLLAVVAAMGALGVLDPDRGRRS